MPAPAVEKPHVKDLQTREPEVPRPNDAVDCLDPLSGDAMAQRCEWVLNNPDIVVMMHAIRVEIMVHYVMMNIVPPEDEDPFQFWLRFVGTSGNLHTHTALRTLLEIRSSIW